MAQGRDISSTTMMTCELIYNRVKTIKWHFFLEVKIFGYFFFFCSFGFFAGTLVKFQNVILKNGKAQLLQ